MLIFDAHIDTLSRLLVSKQTFADSEGHVNLEYLHSGSLGAQFFAAFVHPNYYHGMALHHTLEMIDIFWQMLEKYPDDLVFAGSTSEIRNAQQTARLACLLSIEGGEALEGKLANLRLFYRLGVRQLTLTWNYRNALASGQLEAQGGLSKFGAEVIEAMNDLGMLIDVSHLNEESFWDVLEQSKKPILASHSNARKLCDHPRNLTDRQIKSLADKGGVIGVNFYPPFVSEKSPVTIEHVIEQIDYLVQVAGLDSVALGSDFDGIDQTPSGLENCSKTRQIAIRLAEKGYSDTAVAKIMGENLFRICADVLD